MLRRTTRRPGASLVEVLVGFGILGIGVTSVITLFPFSALTMGQALRDDRTTTCAVIADGELRDIHRQVVEAGTTTQEPYFWTMDNPAWPNNPTLPAPGPNEPSYPVFIDPMGVVAGRGAVGDNRQPTDTLTSVPRVNLLVVQTNPLPTAMALRFCSLMDSLNFDPDGNVPSTSPIDMRELRYNFAWMVQRPRNGDRNTVRMQVVVYNKRAHLYAAPGSEAVYNGVTFVPGETYIANVPAAADVRKGSWVMDATVGPTTDPADNTARWLRHAEFYRVLSVTDANNGTLTLEVHKPVVRADGLSNPANTTSYAYTGTLVSMPGVADVFDRRNLTEAQP